MDQLKQKKRPKLRIHRLSEEQKLVPIRLKIPTNENQFIIDSFDWSLKDDEAISPQQFALELVKSLCLSPTDVIYIRDQIYNQLIDYIENQTFLPKNRQKTQIKNEEEYIPQMRIKRYVRFTSNQFTKRVCKFCKYCHKDLVVQCGNCKYPFRILEQLNLRDQDIKQALTFFHQTYEKIKEIQSSQILDDIQLEDFKDLQSIKQKLSQDFKLLFQKEHIQKQLEDIEINLNTEQQITINQKNDEIPNEFQIQISSESEISQSEFQIKKKRGRPRRSKSFKKLAALKKKIKNL